MRILLLMPMRDRPEPETSYALEHHLDGFEVVTLTTVGLDVVTARNTLWKQAREVGARFDAIMHIDADMYWMPGVFRGMSERLRELGDLDVVSAAACRKVELQSIPMRPLDPNTVSANKMLKVTGALYPAAAVGAGFLMHRAALLDTLVDPWSIPRVEDFADPDPIEELRKICTLPTSEDHAFSLVAIEAGARLFVDTAQIVFNCQDGLAFAPEKLAHRVFDEGGALLRDDARPVENTERLHNGNAMTGGRFGGGIDETTRLFANWTLKYQHNLNVMLGLARHLRMCSGPGTIRSVLGDQRADRMIDDLRDTAGEVIRTRRLYGASLESTMQTLSRMYAPTAR